MIVAGLRRSKTGPFVSWSGAAIGIETAALAVLFPSFLSEGPQNDCRTAETTVVTIRLAANSTSI